MDKIEGKGLSTNDYATEEQTKLANIEEGVNKTIVDAVLNSTSTNPVQNSSVYATLDKKVDKEDGKGLSTNDYTTVEKNKLANISEGAEVNQNAFSTVKIGETSISATGKTDSVSLIGGTNIALTPDAKNKTITNTMPEYQHPTNSGNKHIPAGGSKGQILVWSADGAATWGENKDTTYTAATSTKDGLMSAVDKTKLDNLVAITDEEINALFA